MATITPDGPLLLLHVCIMFASKTKVKNKCSYLTHIHDLLSPKFRCWNWNCLFFEHFRPTRCARQSDFYFACCPLPIIGTETFKWLMDPLWVQSKFRDPLILSETNRWKKFWNHLGCRKPCKYQKILHTNRCKKKASINSSRICFFSGWQTTFLFEMQSFGKG